MTSEDLHTNFHDLTNADEGTKDKSPVGGRTRARQANDASKSNLIGVSR